MMGGAAGFELVPYEPPSVVLFTEAFADFFAVPIFPGFSWAALLLAFVLGILVHVAITRFPRGVWTRVRFEARMCRWALYVRLRAIDDPLAPDTCRFMQPHPHFEHITKTRATHAERRTS